MSYETSWPWFCDERRASGAPRYVRSLVTASVQTPITVSEAKAHARVVSTDEDGLIQNYIKAATAKVERDTGWALLTQTWDIAFDRFPYTSEAIALPIRPIQSVSSVIYYDTAGFIQTVSNTGYVLDALNRRIVLATNTYWPSSVLTNYPVTVRVIAGWTAPNSVPADLLQAVRLLVANFMERREPIQVGNIVVEVPLGYEALIESYTVQSFA